MTEPEDLDGEDLGDAAEEDGAERAKGAGRVRPPEGLEDEELAVKRELAKQERRKRDRIMSKTDLKFSTLKLANSIRVDEWEQGKSTSLEFPFIELAGETGEACDAMKKYIRSLNNMSGGNPDPQEVADELADLCAQKMGVNLGDAVIRKFNETSRKHGFRTTLAEETSQ